MMRSMGRAGREDRKRRKGGKAGKVWEKKLEEEGMQRSWGKEEKIGGKAGKA
jgi:hypothetical protein